MPLDLVGKLHRTVYISECPEDAQEDLLLLMQKRCGAIEAWDVMEERVVVVFDSLNSISTALAFSGMAFTDLTRKIVVWKANEAPPAAAKQQLAIDANQSAAEAEDDKLKRREERAARRNAIQAALGGLNSAFTETEDVERRMQDLCYRQLKALCVLTEDALAKAKVDLAEKERVLHTSKALLDSVCEKDNAAPVGV